MGEIVKMNGSMEKEAELPRVSLDEFAVSLGDSDEEILNNAIPMVYAIATMPNDEFNVYVEFFSRIRGLTESEIDLLGRVVGIQRGSGGNLQEEEAVELYDLLDRLFCDFGTMMENGDE